MEGTPFGRYLLLELLGRGGMGEVWRAFDTVTSRMVALKVLAANLASDWQVEQRFRREAFAAAGLAEPHVVPIHNFGEIDGRLYVDMRLIDGRDLQSILAAGPLVPARAVAIIDQVASALHAAHRIGLVHRDVKPSNVLVAERDFAYLIDFGIARTVGDSGLTGTGSVIGTWHYMAPERFGAKEIDARSDIYALACVLYECLTASRPFPGDTLESQVAAHLSSPPPRPSSTNPGAPRTFDSVIAKGMAKNPEQRYATTEALARAAREAITTPIAIPRPPRQPSPPIAQPRSQPISRAVPPPAQPRPASPVPARPDLEAPRPDEKPARVRRPRRKKALWAGLAAGVGLVAAVVVILVMANPFSTPNTATPNTATPNTATPNTATPNAGPFTGTFSVDFGAPTDLDGAPKEGAPAKESWNLRSVSLTSAGG